VLHFKQAGCKRRPEGSEMMRRAPTNGLAHAEHASDATVTFAIGAAGATTGAGACGNAWSGSRGGAGLADSKPAATSLARSSSTARLPGLSAFFAAIDAGGPSLYAAESKHAPHAGCPPRSIETSSRERQYAHAQQVCERQMDLDMSAARYDRARRRPA